jgi:hypothetical protein
MNRRESKERDQRHGEVGVGLTPATTCLNTRRQRYSFQRIYFSIAIRPCSPTAYRILHRRPKFSASLFPRSRMAPRAYQIVVFGATGFTGSLVAKYLSTIDVVAGSFAVAGRNKAKVAERMKEVGVTAPVIVADSSDHESLVQMCKQTKLVISLVGKPLQAFWSPSRQALTPLTLS